MKKRSSYYEFMSPYFEKGNEQEIAFAKKEYRRIYKKKWQQKSRAVKKAITILCTPNEYNLLEHSAKKYSLTIPAYIKKATISYSYNTYIPYSSVELKKVLQLVALIFNLLQEVEEKLEKDTVHILKATLERIEKLLSDIQKPISIDILLTQICTTKEAMDYYISLISTISLDTQNENS